MEREMEKEKRKRAGAAEGALLGSDPAGVKLSVNTL